MQFAYKIYNYKFSKKEEEKISYAIVDHTAKQVSKSCKDAYDAYYYNYYQKDYELCLIQNNKVIMILNTKIISVKWAIACASRVLDIFEKKYPNDLRPRQAIEAAMRWLNSPTETNKMAAWEASNAAYTAYAAKAAYAAYEANAANAAAKAAYTAYTTAYTAYTTAYTAYAAKAAKAAANAAKAAANAVANAIFTAVDAANAVGVAAGRTQARSKEIAWQRRCLQSIVDRSIAIIYVLKMQQNPKTSLPLDLQKLIINFI